MASQLKIEIAVDDKGTLVVKQFGDNVKQSFDQQKKSVEVTADSLDFFKNRWVQMTAAVTAAWLVMDKTIQWAEMGAKALQAADSFRIMSASASTGADELLESMKRASGGTIEESAIMQKAVKGMMLGFSADQLVNVMEMARVSARVTGQDVQTTYENITDALSTQMPRSLRQYGLITKEQMMVVQEALSAGITDIKLYDMVMANAAIQTAKYGETTQNAAEKVQGFKADMHELAEAFGKMIVAFTVGSQAVADFTNEMSNSEGLKNFSTNLDQIKAKMDAVAVASAEAIQEWDVSEAVTLGKALLSDANSRLGAIEAEKLAIESLKAVNAAYFDDEESRLKYNAALAAIYGESKYETTKTYVEGQIASLNDQYNAQVNVIKREAADRTDRDRQKVSDATVIAAKLEALDAQTATKRDALNRQLVLNWANVLETNRAASANYAYWEQKQFADLVEFARTQGGLRVSMDAQAYDQMLIYQQLTGEQTDETNSEVIKGMIDDYQTTLVGGWRRGLLEMKQAEVTWGSAIYDMFSTFSQSSRSVVSSVLFDGIKGDMKSFGDYWTTFTDAMLKKFTDIIAQMAVQWATFQAAELMGISLPGMSGGRGGGGLGLTGNGLMGYLTSGGTLSGDASLESITQLADLGDIQSMWDVGELGAAGNTVEAGWDAAEMAAMGTEAASGPVGWAILAATMLDKMTGGKGMAALTSLGSSVWGGVSDVASSIGDAASSVVSSIGDFFSGWHEGGLVGYDTPSFSRMMPSIAFTGAPRLHSGFAPDEFPAILQRGERVLSRNQNASYEGGGRQENHFHVHAVVTDERTMNEFVKKMSIKLDEVYKRRIGAG